MISIGKICLRSMLDACIGLLGGEGGSMGV